MPQVVNVFCLLGFSEELRDTVLCVSWGNQDLFSRLHCCCLFLPCLFISSLPCLNLPFGTQGRSGNGGHRNTFMAKSPTGSCSVSVPQIQISVSQDCPHFSSSWKSWVVTYASDRLAVNQRFLWTPPWVQSMCQRSSQNSENIYLHLPVYYKR